MFIPAAHPLETRSTITLFQAGQDPSPAAGKLLNPEITQAVEKGGAPTLTIERDTDPYRKVEWLLRFEVPPPQDWKSIVLEIEFFDEGAGVIQPVLLSNDQFDGEWAPPLRSVSFTRLNSQRTRSALFEFQAPELDWTKTKNPHLKIAGLQYLKAIRVFPQVDEARWEAESAGIPVEVTPLVSLNRPMEINCTVGIEDVGEPPSLANSLANIREYAPLAKLLGFTSVECFVRWDMLEPQPGVFDFSHYDRIVQEIGRYGLKWFPNLVITSAFALPDWYYTDPSNQGFVCLEHRETNQVPSIWKDSNRTHVTRVLKAFGDHYEPMGILEAVRLGPSGNFGEAQYPAGAGKSLGYAGAPMHGHIGWWAGDPLAKKDFQEFLRDRYKTIETLNSAWGEDHESFETIEPRLPETYRERRGRLDMTEWYTDSMTEWCDFWGREARAAMPNTRIYQSSGGWGFRETGTDFSAQAKSMSEISGGIRLTNETDSFEQNVYATRLAATAARLYGIALGYEPAGFHSARGTVARFFSAASTNGTNLYTRHSVLFTHPYSVDNWLRDYPLLDLRQPPVIDVAIYYPETMNQLDDGAFRHLYAWGFNPRAAEIRRRIDVDYLDDRLLRDGFLDKYAVLVFCWGNVIPADALAIIDRWVRAGGTVILPTYPRGPLETIEGETAVYDSWALGDAGQGAFHRFQGDMEPITLYGDFVEGILKKVSRLNPWTTQVLSIEHPAQVFFSLMEDGHLLILNYSDQPATIRLPGKFEETLAPLSITTRRLE